MAKVIYDMYKDTNMSSKSYGHVFGRVVHVETMNTKALSRHIMEHGSPYTEDVVLGVLTKAESCIIEMLLQSKKVKLDGLGTLYLMAENKKGGETTIDDFNPKTSFKGLHIRFLPDSTTEDNLTSREMLSKAQFIFVDDLVREKAIHREKEEPDPEPEP
jgi:nucleoid DNA-binding protein